jgi:hypothetical protein
VLQTDRRGADGGNLPKTEQFTGKFVERGPKKAPTPQGYAQFMGVFADFIPAKINRERISKEQGNRSE